MRCDASCDGKFVVVLTNEVMLPCLDGNSPCVSLEVLVCTRSVAAPITGVGGHLVGVCGGLCAMRVK